MAATNKHMRWSEEKISSAVMIVLLTLSIAVFAMFFLSGYDEPWEENTEFISPRHTDSLINLMFGVGIAAAAATLLSSLWFVRCRGHAIDIAHGIPAAKIAAIVLISIVLAAAISYLFSSDSMIMINGKAYSDTLWLNMSDTLIYTAEIMLAIAAAAVVFGMSGISRRIKKH